jgi:hypothetical protein
MQDHLVTAQGTDFPEEALPLLLQNVPAMCARACGFNTTVSVRMLHVE